MAAKPRVGAVWRWNGVHAYFLGMALVFAPGLALAQSIVTDGRTATTVSTSGATTSVSTATVSGQNAFNSFSRFGVPAGATVNLYLPTGTANLVNIVRDERTDIFGVLNSIKDGAIGGKVWFANPHGFMVGATGVVNVGSLTLTTPTQQFVDRFFSSPGNPDPASVSQLLDGTAPRNAAASIEVNGRINAIEEIALLAGTIRIGGGVYAGARFFGEAPDFSDIVNVSGLQTGAALVADGGSIRVVGEGDVTLSGTLSADGSGGGQGGSIDVRAGRDLAVQAGARLSAKGSGESSNGGTVVAWADRDAVLGAGALLDAGAGLSGDGGFVEFSARRTVELAGGELRADGTGGGRAGTALVDPENIVVSANILRGAGGGLPDGASFAGANLTLVADESITVNSGIVISSRAVDTPSVAGSHTGGASTGDSGNITIVAPTITLGSGSQILAHATGAHAAGDVTLQASRSSSSILDGTVATAVNLNGATVRGRDITISASSSYASPIVDSPVLLKTVSAKVDANGATLSATRDILLSATATVDAETPSLLPLATIDITSEATVDVHGASTISSTGGKATLSATSTVTAKAIADTPDVVELPGDAGVAIVIVDSTASVDVRGTSSVNVTGALELSATNTVDVLAKADASANGVTAVGGTLALSVIDTTTRATIGGAATVTQAGSIRVAAESVNTIVTSATAATGGADEKGTDGPDGSKTEETLADYQDAASTSDGGVQVAAAVAVADIDSTTEAFLASSGAATTSGALTVSSQSLNQSDVTADGSAASGDVGVGVGVAVNVAKAFNDAYVAQTVNAAGATIAATVAGTGEKNSFSATSSSGAAASNVGVAGSLSVNIVENRTRGLVKGVGVVNAGGGDVSVESQNESEATASAVPGEAGVSGDSIGIGASVALNVLTNESRAEVENGGQVAGARHVSLAAGGNYVTTTEAEAGAAGGIAATPVAAIAIVDNATTASLGTGGTLTLSGNLSVSAAHAATTTSSATADVAGENVGIGVSLALNVVSDAATATTARAISSTGGGVAFEATSASATSSSAKASAKGGKQEEEDTPEDGVDQEIGRQKDYGTDKQAAGSANQGQQASSAESKEGKLSVAGAVAVNVVDSSAEAYVPDNGSITASGGALTVSATNNTDAKAIADGSATDSGSMVGVGVAVGINTVTATTHAYVGSSASVTAQGVNVTTGMTDAAGDGSDLVNTFETGAKSGGGGGKVGIAGSLALNVVDVSSTAELKSGASVAAGGLDVKIAADSASSTIAKATPHDGGGNGAQVGVGASVALNLFTQDRTTAAVRANAGVTGAHDIEVTATSDSDTTTEAEGGAGGGIAIDAVVALAEIKQTTEAVVASGSKITATGEMTISATATGEHSATATGDVKSTKVGIGASAAVILSDTSTTASLARDLDATGLGVSASATRTYEAVAYASAGGGKDEDQSTQQEKDRATSTSTLKNNESSQQGTGKTGSSSKVNVAAAAGVVVLDDDVTASVAAGRTLDLGSGALGISAFNSSDFSGRGRGDTLDPAKLTSGQDVGIGIGVGLAITRNDTAATLGANTHVVQAGSVDVSAESKQNTSAAFLNKLSAEGVSGAGANKVAVAGSLAVANSEATTQASIGNGAVVDQADAVSVTADNTSKLSAKAWSGAVSSKVGIGASVAVVYSKNEYHAWVGPAADITAASLSVAARNHKVSGAVPFDWNFSLDGASADKFETKLSEGNLQVLLGENNYYTEALAGAGGGQVAVTGSFAINIFDDSTQAWLGSGSSVATTGAVSLEARNETTAKAFAGALAVGRNAGVGLNTADIVNSSRTLAYIDDDASVLQSGSIALTAGASMDFGVFGAALGAANTAGIAGVASVIVADNEVAAYTGEDAVLVSSGNASLQATNHFESLTVAGGAGGGNSAGVGASAAVNEVNSITRAEVGARTQLDAAGATTVSAAASEDTTIIVVAGGVAGTAGVGAGVATNLIDTLTTATIAQGAKVNVGADGDSVLVSASDDTKLLSIAGGVGAAGTAGVGAGVDVGVITKTVTASIEGGSAEVRALENVAVTAAASEEIFSVAAAASLGGTAAVSGAATGYSVATTTQALVDGGATVYSHGNVVIDADSATEATIIAGGASIGGTAGVGASVAVLVTDKLTEAAIEEGARVTALGAGNAGVAVDTGAFGVTFTAYDPSQSGKEAQAPSMGTDAASAGGDLLTKKRTAGKQTKTIRGLAVTATGADDVKIVTAAGSVGGAAGVSLGANVATLSSDVSATIGKNALINQNNTGAHAEQSVLVGAGNDLYRLGVSGLASGGGAVGGGAGADVTIIENTATASIGESANVKVRRDVEVGAHSSQDLVSVAAVAAAGGTVGLAGAVGTVVLTSTTQAGIGASATVDADGNVRVAASDETELVMVAGSAGIGLGAVGVGASVGVSVITKNTTAFVGNGATVTARGGKQAPPVSTDVPVGSTPDDEDLEADDTPSSGGDGGTEIPVVVDGASDMAVYSGESLNDMTAARGLSVEASSSEDLKVIAAAGSGGLYAGVSGAISVESVKSTTQAYIGDNARINTVDNALANAAQDVNVTARNDAKLLVVDGSLAVGPLGAGVAGSVDVGLIRNDTGAWIGTGAEVHAQRDVDVNALSGKNIDSIVISAAGGIVGIAAGVGVYSVGAALDQDSRDRLASGGSTAQGDADAQVKDGTATSLLSDFGESRLNSIGAQAQAKRSAVAVSGDLTAAPPAGNSAAIRSNAVIHAGRHVDVDARESVQFDLITGAAAGGVVGLGAGIGIALFNSNNTATIGSGARITAAKSDAEGDITVTARLDSSASGESYAGSAGVVAADAALAILKDTSIVQASVGNNAQLIKADAVRIEAIDRRLLHAQGLGASAGAAAVGASVATVTIGGEVNATFGTGVQVGQGPDEVDNLTLTADSASTAHAETVSAKAGIGLAASGSAATAKNEAAVKASLGANGRITTQGITSVSALTAPQARAEALGVNVSGGASIGASVAIATSSPTVTAEVQDGVHVNGGGLSVLAQNQPAPGTASAHAHATGASGGLLLGANATAATATSDADVIARVGNSVRLPDGDVLVRANNASLQEAEGLGIAAGFVAVGANVVEAHSTNTTQASIGTGAQTSVGRLGSLAVVAEGDDDNNAFSEAGSGGVVAGNASSAATSDTSTVTASFGGGTTVYAGSFLVDASHRDAFEPVASSVNAAALGASGAFASHSASSAVSSTLGNNLIVHAFGPAAVSASNLFEDAGTERATGAAGGVANGAAVYSETTLGGNASVTTGTGVQLHSGTDPALNPGGIQLAAATFLNANEQVSLASGGLLAGAFAQSKLTASVTNSVTVGQSNQLRSQGHVGVGTFTQALAATSSLVNTWGGAAVGSAESHNTLTSNQSVSVGASSFIQGFGNVDIAAGKDPGGLYETLISGTSSAQGYVRGVIAVPDAEARTTVTSNSSLNIGAGATIRSGLNTVLGAYKGTPLASADGTGRGYQLGFIPVTEHDSNASVLTSSSIVHNGAVTAGIYNVLDITIPNCANAGPGNQFCSQITSNPEAAPFLAQFVPNFSPTDFIEENFTGTGEQILGSGVSSTPVGAFVFGTLFAAGGTVTLHGDSISGSGSATAKGGPRVTVTNNSRDYVVLGPVLIPNTPGGRVLFTGGAGAAQAPGISITEVNPNGVPSVVIANNFNGVSGSNPPALGPAIFLSGAIENLGGLVSITNVAGSLGQTATIFGQEVQISAPAGAYAVEIPFPGVYYAGGNPYSEWQNAMIWPGGNPANGVPNANQAASWVANAFAAQNLGYTPGSGIANLNALLYGFAGDVDNQSYVFAGSCLPFVGSSSAACTSQVAATLSAQMGGPGWAYKISNSDFNERWFPYVPERPLSLGLSYGAANLTGSAASAQIYGGRVSIDAGYVDINGKIVAGQSTEWSAKLDASLTAAGTKILGFPVGGGAIWQHDQLYRLGLAGPTLELPASAIGLVNPAVDKPIKAIYDARTGQITLDNVSASSGGAKVIIRGRIISTNTLGQIHINGGLGTVQVENQTGRELVLQNINTGNTSLAAALQSEVSITDLNRSGNNQWLYVHNPVDGLKVYNGAAGASAATLMATTPVYNSTTDAYFFDPLAGLRWEWELRATLSREISSGWSFTNVTNNNPWRYATSSSPFSSTQTKPTGWLTTGNSTSLPAFTQSITASGLGWSTMNVYYHGCGSTTCNFGFRRTTDNSPVKDPGTPGAQWRYHRYTSAQLNMRQSVKADNRISIDFSGNPTGTVKVTSNAPVLLSGQILNPNGDTTIVTGGNLQQTANGNLSTHNASLTANGGGIGTVGSPFRLSLTGDGRLDASAGAQGIYLDINSAARLGSITAGNASGYGDVVLHATNDLLRAPGLASSVVNVTGRNISLTSDLGSIGQFGTNGADGTPLVISAKPTLLPNSGVSGGIVDAHAQTDIALEQRGGNLLVGEIEAGPSSNVYLSVPQGALLSASGQTAAQALTPDQIEKIRQDLKLTAAYGAEQEGDANAASVKTFEGQIDRHYEQYWRVLAHGSVQGGQFVLDDGKLDLFRPLAGAALGVGSPTDAQVRAYANQLYQNALGALDPVLTEKYGAGWQNLAQFQTFDDAFRYQATTDQVNALTRNAVWTENELNHAINRTALEPASGTPVGLGTPNITGRNIVLNAANGIGKLANPVFISVADLQAGNLTSEQAAALALATTPGDVISVGVNGLGEEVTFAFDAKPADVTLTGFRIAQTAPLFIDAAGALKANSGGVAYVQSAGQVLTLDQVVAAGDVSLSAPQSIVSAGTSPVQVVTPGNATLVAGSGNLGASATDPLVLQVGGQLAAASAGQNAWLRQMGGNLTVGRVFAGGMASLDAAQGSLVSYLDGVAVQAQDITLAAQDDIGSQVKPFAVQLSGQLDGTAGGSAWVFAPATTTTLDVGTFSAGNDLHLTAEGHLQAASLQSSGGAIVATSLGNLTLDSATAPGAVTLQAGGAARVEGDVTTTTGDISVNATSLFMVDGAALESTSGTIDIQATGDVTLGRVQTGNATADAVSITTTGRILDGGDLGVYDIIANTAGARVTLEAAQGVGVGNPLETLVHEVEATSTTGAIAITEGDGLAVTTVQGAAGVAISAAGAITGGTVSSTGSTASVTSTADAVALTTVSGQTGATLSGQGNVDVGTLSSGAGSVSATSSGGNINVVTASGATNVTLDAAGSIAAAQTTATAGSVTMTAQDTITTGSVDAGQNASLTATAGDIDAGTTTAGSNASFNAGGSIVATQTTATAGSVAMSAQDAITATTLDAGLDVSLATVSGDIMATTTTAGRDVTMLAGNDLWVDSIDAGRHIRLSGRNLDARSVVTTGGSIDAEATVGDLNADTVTGSGAVTLEAGQDANIGDAESTNGNLTVRAQRDVNVVSAKAKNVVTLDSVGGQLNVQHLQSDGAIILALDTLTGGQLNVGTSLVLAANIIDATIDHTRDDRALLLTLTGRAAPLATRMDIRLNTEFGGDALKFWAHEATLDVAGKGWLNIRDGIIENRFGLTNPVSAVLMDNLSPAVQPADVQLYAPAKAFWLNLDRNLVRTNAYVIHRNEATHSVISTTAGEDSSARERANSQSAHLTPGQELLLKQVGIVPRVTDGSAGGTGAPSGLIDEGDGIPLQLEE